MTALVRVPFDGTELLAVRGATPAATLIAMRPLVEAMGLSWAGQYRKLERHPVLAEAVAVTATETGEKAMVCLQLPRLNFWLATLSTQRIADPGIRERVLRYQREAADVLFQHFFSMPAASIAVGPMDENARRVLGGIVKGVVHREVTAEVAVLTSKIDGIAALLADRVPDPTAAPAEMFVSALAYLKRIGWQQHGRRGLVGTIGAKLARYSAQAGYPVRLTAERGVRLFHVDAVVAWERVEGRAFLADARDRLGGQHRLPLTGPARRRRSASAAQTVQ